MEEENGLLPFERQQFILTRLKEEQQIRVTDLSEQLQVSLLTIRRDLAVLEEKGLVERCHGGAILPRRKTIEIKYDEKQTSWLAEKEKIGIEAAKYVQDHETIFINSGSTTKEVIRALNGRPLRIITTNIDAISVVTAEETELVLLGGTIRKQSMSTVGEIGLKQMEEYFPDRVIVGCDAFSSVVGLTAPTESEAIQSQKMISRSRGDVIVVADHSKMGVISTYKVADLGSINHLITDQASETILDPEALEKASVIVSFV